MAIRTLLPTDWLLVAVCYLIGAIPFGYLIGRLNGVNLFAAGSGNIGATNVGRVLGRRVGVLVFVLDFLKGVLPVVLILPAAMWTDWHWWGRWYGLAEQSRYVAYPADRLQVYAGLAAFFGHLFPIYLGFRGGKGVATGAGVVSVLMPVPAAAAVIVWAAVALFTRYVSLASVLAAVVLCVVHLFDIRVTRFGLAGPVSAFCFGGAALVIFRHRGNLRRLLAGTESRIEDGPMRQTALKVVHVLALGLWAGGAGFFTFLAAPAMNREFAEVVATAPNTRTANRPLLPRNAGDADRKELGSALFGAAVGPVFPRLFAVQVVCSVLALGTAAAWWPLGGVHRRRVWVLLAAMVIGAAGLWLSAEVTGLRPKRFDPDPAVAAAAKRDFGPWHLASLATTGVMVLLAGVGLGMAARLPADRPPV